MGDRTWKSGDSDEVGIPIKNSLDKIAKQLGTPGVDSLKNVFSLWPEVVGKAIADHTEPVSIKDRTLQVLVDNQKWLSQLKWSASSLIEQINKKSPETKIEELEFKLKK